ncbi:hypothetical protein ACHAXT_002789 [Thalassiosira profunda]
MHPSPRAPCTTPSSASAPLTCHPPCSLSKYCNMSLLYRGDKKLSILEVIEHAEYCLNQLKNDVLFAGEDASLSASAILTTDGHGKRLSTAVAVLQTMAKQQAGEAWEELYAFLDNHQRWPKIMFWSHFHTKLKTLGKTGVDFRKDCLFRRLESNDCTLFHEVCKLKPPVKVVQTMIDITPIQSEDRFLCVTQYNHLGQGGGTEYPLHAVLRHGGSLDLVKLLVSADKEGDTLSGRNSVYHALAANKEKHPLKAFSEILRYLVLLIKAKDFYFSPLLKENDDDKTPLGLLAESLKEEGLSNTEILQHKDFAFLLKATCYHYRNSRSREEGDGDPENIRSGIEAIPLDRAFLVCCPCFDAEFAAAVLEKMASADKAFLLDKDASDNDRYPLHHILESRPAYSVMVGTNNFGTGFKLFIVETILRLAPEAAQQWNKKGRLPLHIAADAEVGASMLADQRLSLVNTIWKAYPEAVGLMDKELSLPPFALPTRAEMDSHRRPYVSDDDYEDEYTAFSSTYFLLRQQPEMLAEVVANCSTAKAESTEPSAKRQRTNSTKACN